MENKVVYDTKQIAELLDVASSTVRKYCDYLEKAGYDFHKNEHGHRGFFDQDVIVFRKLIEYKRAMSLEKATNAVMAWKKGNDIAPPDTPNPHHSARHSDLMDEFQKFQEQQQAFNLKMIERLEKQEQRQAERDKNLMQVLNQTVETQKQLAAAEKKRWWQFWK